MGLSFAADSAQGYGHAIFLKFRGDCDLHVPRRQEQAHKKMGLAFKTESTARSRGCTVADAARAAAMLISSRLPARMPAASMASMSNAALHASCISEEIIQQIMRLATEGTVHDMQGQPMSAGLSWLHQQYQHDPRKRCSSSALLCNMVNAPSSQAQRRSAYKCTS